MNLFCKVSTAAVIVRPGGDSPVQPFTRNGMVSWTHVHQMLHGPLATATEDSTPSPLIQCPLRVV